MNKSKKRQLHVRNKLIAAVAMLLVSSIMMVSTTYAWFTLSTAPEVQGITTTVGANGSLEIALSPMNGDYNEIKSSVGDSNRDWFEKNVTWGNLLDLSDTKYELSAVTLMPAQLKLSAGAVDITSPLARPAYGADGRVSDLKADTSIGGKIEEKDEEGNTVLSSGFQVSEDDYYGVRAIGTSSGMSENERVFTSGKSALRTGTSQAASVASASLNANGDALANLMVAHAMVKGNDEKDYSDYVEAVTSLVAALEDSVTQIDNAMKGALIAAAATTLTSATTPTLETAQTAINGATDIGAFDISSYVTDTTVSEAFATLQSKRNSIKSDVDAAKTALNNINAEDGVTWDEIYGVVKYLMNTTGVKINGETVDYVSANYTNMISDLISGVDLTLGEGSGVYYKIHEIAGKVSAATAVTIDASGIVSGMGNVTVNSTIVTTYNSVSYLPAMTATLTDMDAATESGEGAGATKLDVYYGYVLDFVFRTNAAGSSLQLQTEAANRVYSEDGSELTQGSGSNITFTVPTGVDANIVKGLVEGIRVVFYDTASGEIYGVAKVTSVNTEEVTGTDGTTTNLVGTLELCAYETDSTTGLVTVGDVIEDTTPNDNIDQTKALCALDQNVAKRVSAMVYLDGSDITNADIMAEGNVTGVLNLQFSSSADLVPMNNSELKDGGSSNDNQGE